MSEVYNDKDTNYDYEEPFDEEMDNEELDDEYEESPENMTLKEKAEAKGMSVREYISEVSFRRGPVGVISGIGFGIIGVFGQAVHVLIKAIVFGEHEKADLWNAFKKYYALSNNKNLDGDTKEEKGQKEVKDKGQENNQSEKATEAQERTRQQVEYEQDSKDAAMSVMLNNQEIAKAFTNIGLSAESQKGTDHILLFKTEHKGNLNLQKTFCAMSKDDLLNKNANSLAAAIFSYHKTDPGKEDEIKLLSTMKAVTAVATVQYLANKEDVENSLINGEQLELSFATIETKNGAADLSIKTSSEYKDMVDIEYNGVAVASMPVSELTEHSFASYQEKLMGPLNKAAEFVYPIQIGTTDRITFNRGTDGGVQVEAKLIYDNSMAIDHFVSRTYYYLTADYGNFKASQIDKHGKYVEYATADEVKKQSVPLNGKVLKKDVKDEYTNAPQLYDLSAIQVEAGRLYKMSPKEVLATIQSLYETHKVISYPRTQCRYVSSEKAKEFPDMLKKLLVFPELKPYVEKISVNDIKRVQADKRIVNDKEVEKESHDALLPTDKTPDLSKLSEIERQICLLIYTRLLAQFLPKLRQQKTKLFLQHGDKLFYTTGKMVIDEGWRKLYGSLKNIELPLLLARSLLTSPAM